MKEHKFQRLGVTDSESIKAIGELVNADYIVVGKIATFVNDTIIMYKKMRLIMYKKKNYNSTS